MTIRTIRAVALCLLGASLLLNGCASGPSRAGGAVVEERSVGASRAAPTPPPAEQSSETIPLEQRQDIQAIERGREAAPSGERGEFAPAEPATETGAPLPLTEPPLTAPSTTTPGTDSGQPSRGGPSRAEPIPEIGPAQGSPAVLALLNDAGKQASSGSLDGAAAALERAVRIDPRNPAVWSRLAEIRLEQGLGEQAENLAKKSNTLAGRNYRLQARNWRIIARARGAHGDTAGAEAADQTAEALETQYR